MYSHNKRYYYKNERIQNERIITLVMFQWPRYKLKR